MNMNVYEYCDSVTQELTNWKNKLSTLDHKIASLPCSAKEEMVGSIGELHMVMAEMDERISNLEHACPASWRPEGRA